MSADETEINRWTEQIIGAAIEVHRTLGPGLLESIYQAALEIELRQRGVPFERQKRVHIEYKGESAGDYCVDLIVGEMVVVELKAVSALDRIHDAQLLTYLRLTKCPVGLLLNFNVTKLVDGVKRFRL